MMRATYPFATIVLLQCYVAYRVGMLLKNFLVLLVATSYLWRPYLQRVQVRSQPTAVFSSRVRAEDVHLRLNT